MQNPNEYDVYPRSYFNAMSEEEEPVPDETEKEQGPDEAAGPAGAGFKLDGYTTLFDTKVSLTPVELIPLTGVKK